MIKILCFLLLSIFKLHSPKNNALKISFTIMARLREKLGPTCGPSYDGACGRRVTCAKELMVSLSNTDPTVQREAGRMRDQHPSYLQSLPTRVGCRAALAASQIYEVYAACDSMVMLFPFHEFCLQYHQRKIKQDFFNGLSST